MLDGIPKNPMPQDNKSPFTLWVRFNQNEEKQKIEIENPDEIVDVE